MGVPTREIETQEITAPWEAVLCTGPGTPSDVGLLVLAGSSGRVDRARAALFAGHGLTTLAVRWFGGPGQQPAPCEVPLETFTAAVDLLQARGVSRIGILGTSKGAEAALLTAVRDPRVDVVVAISPPAHVWGWNGRGSTPDGGPADIRSSWTWQGRPLDFVPMDKAWAEERQHLEGPAAIRSWYETSERTYADRLEAAAIPVEDARADVVLVAGGDDALWPSARSAARLAARRRAAGRSVHELGHPEAGHRPVFPGEDPPPPSPVLDYGGTFEADAQLGADALSMILTVLRGESFCADLGEATTER